MARTAERRRQIGAWLALVVFVPMLLMASLHRHPQFAGGQQADDCTYCFNHLPHDGHFSVDTQAVDDCVLCQFVSLVYTAATLLLVATPLTLVFTRHAAATSPLARWAGSTHPCRAPPSVCFAE